MASVTPMSFFTPDASINPDEYTFEIADAQARKFSNAIILSSAFDMNNMLEPGVYRADIAATSITNWPHVDGWLYFIVLGNHAGTSNRVQIVIGGRTESAAGRTSYVRYRVNGAWKDWVGYRKDVVTDVAIAHNHVTVASFPANNYKEVEVPIPSVAEGYSYVNIIRAFTTSSSVLTGNVYMRDSKIFVVCRNVGTTAVSNVDVYVGCLFKKMN